MTSTISDAKEYISHYYSLENPSEKDDIFYVECLKYLIQETNDSRYMMELGGWYYAKRDFDLAEKYYLMAAEQKDSDAYECLGYIYYYGRVGKPDYKKAFEYYKKGYESGLIVSSYKLADMYRNGYYVQKNYEAYTNIIKNLYPKVKDMNDVFDPVPEIFTRLAKIYIEEENVIDAANLLIYAKDFLAQRIVLNGFFGNLTIMKCLVKDLYSIVEFNPDYIDLFDLYYVLEHPSIVLITYSGQDYILDCTNIHNIVLDDKVYQNVDDFFENATLSGIRFSSLYLKLDYLEIMKLEF